MSNASKTGLTHLGENAAAMYLYASVAALGDDFADVEGSFITSPELYILVPRTR